MKMPGWHCIAVSAIGPHADLPGLSRSDFAPQSDVVGTRRMRRRAAEWGDDGRAALPHACVL